MIPVYQPYLTGREKEYVLQCLDSTWISSRGEFIGKFERRFADYIGAPHATSVVNGTAALHLAMLALGIKAGDEVIVPTLTYIASVNTIMQTGATPVFAESMESSWNIDPADIERKITPRTKAVMAVPLYGLPCDMDAIVDICNRRKLLLIEDCAEAFGTLYKGRHVGTFGDAATFSFFGNKTITTGEGGMVVMRDETAAARAYHLKTQGVSPQREYWHDIVAYNYRMTNICAAIGLAQLEQADAILEKKRVIANSYRKKLAGLPVAFHDELPDTRHSFWMCSIAARTPQDRDGLRARLEAEGVETRPVFHPAHTLPHCATGQSFPVAEKIAAHGLNLPSYPALTEKDIDTVCDAVRGYFADQLRQDVAQKSLAACA
ncbi:MAG: DegT/DnrJ/EryC1/StrS family aminotransferase [Alphaproteobacteria bacterium]